MSVFSPADDLVDLLDQDTPRSYGVPLSSHDAFSCLLSVQIAVPNTAQMAWDSDTTGWNGGMWDDPNWATWTDITSRVRGVEWDRGATDPITEPEVGTAQITLDNRDGYVSPWAMSGPFTNPVNGDVIWDSTGWNTTVPGSGASLIRPNTIVRFGVTSIDTDGNESWLPFFTGLIETVTEDTEENVDGWVTLGLVDLTALLAAVGSGLTTGSAMTAGMYATPMINALLTDIGSQLDNINGGPLAPFNVVTLQVPDPTMNRLQAAQLIAASVHCRFFAEVDGFYWIADETNTTQVSSYAFSNAPGAGELPVVSITPYSSFDRLLNSATGTAVGGIAQTATDDASIQQFGIQANALGWPRTDLLEQLDADVLTLAVQTVNDQSNDFLGISAIDLDADQDPVHLYGEMANYANQGLKFNARINVRWVHPSGNVFALALGLIGFHNSITMEGSQAKWTATYRTALAH